MSVDWYVACRFTTVRRVNAEYVPQASSMAHAKRMGGSSAACGEVVSTMTKLFDVPFPVAGQNCPKCLDVVRAEGRRARGSL